MNRSSSITKDKKKVPKHPLPPNLPYQVSTDLSSSSTKPAKRKASQTQYITVVNLTNRFFYSFSSMKPLLNSPRASMEQKLLLFKSLSTRSISFPPDSTKSKHYISVVTTSSLWRDLNSFLA